MNVHLNINTDNLVAYTNALERLPKYALPVAIRGTLNDVGFEMKKTTLPRTAKSIFEERQPNFFKANSRVEMATGMNIPSMVTTVGMVSSGLHNAGTNYAVRDLEEQEESGTIRGRSFKPLPGARRGGRGNVKSNAHISQILKAGNVIDARDSRGANMMQKFIRASIHAGEGGYVLGGKILWRVKRITRHGRNTKFTKEKLYSFTKHGTATVHATHFMKRAAEEAQKEMESFYRIQANRQIGKALARFK